jgi:hypothetical protein
MTFGAPETEALYEGNAQKGFGVFKPRWEPLSAGLNSHQRAHRDPKISVEEVGAPDATGLKTLWIKKHSNPIQRNISDNQQPSGDKRLCGY